MKVLTRILVLASTASATSMVRRRRAQQEQQQEQQQQDALLEGIYEDFPGLQDLNGDGIPDFWNDIAGVGDCVKFDPVNNDYGCFQSAEDYRDVVFTTQPDWQDFLQLPQSDPSLDFCPILETVVGFGVALEATVEGGCDCEVGNGSDLSIACMFQSQCVPGSNDNVCGSLSMQWDIPDASGAVQVGGCVDFDNDDYQQFCMEYTMGMIVEETAVLTRSIQHSCTATYGGKDCECNISTDMPLCWQVDCSAYLPGLAMDTCQPFAAQEAAYLPQFQVFDADFTGIDVSTMDWASLDWANLDWENFSWANMIQSDAGSNWEQTPVSAIVVESDPTVACPVLQRFLQADAAFAAAGDCACTAQADGALFMTCNGLDTQCNGDLCGAVAIDFTMSSMAAAQAEVCVDWAQDVGHARTCYTYTIPVAADPSTMVAPTCSATYDGKDCTCTIQNGVCLAIDCSEYDENAVMNTCQALPQLDLANVQSCVPSFAGPVTSLISTTPDVDETVDSSTPTDETVDSSTPTDETVDSSTPTDETVDSSTPNVEETVDSSTPTEESLEPPIYPYQGYPGEPDTDPQIITQGEEDSFGTDSSLSQFNSRSSSPARIWETAKFASAVMGMLLVATLL